METIITVVQGIQCLLAFYILLASLQMMKHSQRAINLAGSILLVLFIIVPPVGRKYISAASKFK